MLLGFKFTSKVYIVRCHRCIYIYIYYIYMEINRTKKRDKFHQHSCYLSTFWASKKRLLSFGTKNTVKTSEVFPVQLSNPRNPAWRSNSPVEVGSWNVRYVRWGSVLYTSKRWLFRISEPSTTYFPGSWWQPPKSGKLTHQLRLVVYLSHYLIRYLDVTGR